MANDYEPITKELREKMVYTMIGGNTDVVVMEKTDFEAFCDNIDAIHRSLEQENERLRDASERGDDWIKLPVDADGKSIHIGDVMDNTHKDGFIAKSVIGISFHDGPKPCIQVNEDRLRWHNADKLRHHKPDTWESIIEDAIDTHGNGFNPSWTDERDALVARCKALCERTREGEE